MKKRTKKHNPSFSFNTDDGVLRFELMPGGIVRCDSCFPNGNYDPDIHTCFEDNALDVIANLRQAAAEIERMYSEQEGK